MLINLPPQLSRRASCLKESGFPLYVLRYQPTLVMMLTLNLVSGLFVLFNFVFCRVIFKIDNDILKRIRIKTHIITNSNIFVSQNIP